MRIIITEKQKGKLVMELSSKSSGVKEFLEMVKQTPGLLKFLKFNSHKSLEDYILDANYKEFQELKKEAKEFENKKK